LNFLFAWRYFKSKKSTNAVNIIAYISIVAIMIGTAALILVLSVFNGFESLVKNLYNDFYADAKIVPVKGKSFHLNNQQYQLLQTNSNIAYWSKVVEEKALLKNSENQATVIVKGVQNNYTNIAPINKHIIRGSFDIGNTENPKIVIGSGIESATAIYLEQPLEDPVLFLPNKKAVNLNSINNAFLSYNVIPSGTFVLQQDFDNKYIFTNLPFMQFMLDMDSTQFSYLELKLTTKSSTDEEKIIKQLQQQLGTQVKVLSRYEQNKSLYTIMQIEKWIIYGILCLILIVAAFNMIGSLTMLILEKQKDIAILKAIGANDVTIKNIFITNGFILAFVGSFIGILLATLICWLQIKFKLLKLSGSFVVDYYPVEMRWQDYLLVLFTVFIIAFIASFIPASKANRQNINLKS